MITACFSTQLLRSGASKRHKRWTSLISGQFIDTVETHIAEVNFAQFGSFKDNRSFATVIGYKLGIFSFMI